MMTDDYRDFKQQMESLFDFITANVGKTKMSMKSKVKIREEMSNLRSFVLNARPARIAIVGRRGAGKSSLINAVFGEKKAEVGDYKAQTGVGKWYLFENDLGGVDILDTRGLGEGHTPDEMVLAANPIEEIMQSVREKCPDVILFLCKAKEVGARIDEDLEQLQQLKTSIHQIHQYDVPIVGVVTQVDELAPVSVSEPPFADPRKQKNIEETVQMLSEKVKEKITTPVTILPISAYMEFHEDGTIAYDRRYQIDTLLDYLMTELPQEAQVILAKISKVKSVQKKLARGVGKSVAAITGVVGASPIPMADMPVITGLQLSMIGSVAMISGEKLNRKSMTHFLGAMGVNVGVGFALRTISRQLVKIFPGAGSIISGTIASAGTLALCEASITYFIDRKSKEEAKKVYEQQLEKNKGEKIDGN